MSEPTRMGLIPPREIIEERYDEAGEIVERHWRFLFNRVAMDDLRRFAGLDEIEDTDEALALQNEFVGKLLFRAVRDGQDLTRDQFTEIPNDIIEELVRKHPSFQANRAERRARRKAEGS